MKDLSIEEKAQRYDEALKQIKECTPDENGFITIYPQEIFPELKESEDEEIRKSIIAILNNYVDNSNTFKPKMIAWLEKQSMPQVRTGLEWVNTIDDACDKRYSEEYAHGKYCHEQSFKWGFQEGVDWLEKQGDANKEYWRGYREGKQEILDKYAEFEKQGEQKPIDKVKPKFHEGEWITNGNYTWKIVEVKSLDYILQSQDGNIVDDTISHVDEQFHSFTIETIEDVEDGDVLAVEPIEGYSSSFVAIYKKQNEEDFDSYCFVGFDGKFYDGENGHSTEGIHPAAKEQRDILFKKMKEAGYEWDAEKKELKKIEQKPADKSKIKPKFKTGDRVIGIVSGMQYFITEVCDDHYYTESGCIIMFCSQDNFELYEQKPAEWSEEDEKIALSIEQVMNCASLLNIVPEKVDKIRTWLKSIKDRVQPQHKEWSEEDDAIRNDLINYFRGSALETSEKKVINWLKSIKDRVQPQKQEWSDVDKDILFRIINDLKFLKDDISKDTKYAVNIVDVEREINWLKSLKDRVLPQYKEWNEEDEHRIQKTIDFLKHPDLIKATPTLAKDTIKWLKSLRPQNTWRPSDEQLNNILDVLSFDNCTPKRRELLESLYNDLRKLRE